MIRSETSLCVCGALLLAIAALWLAYWPMVQTEYGHLIGGW